MNRSVFVFLLAATLTFGSSMATAKVERANAPSKISALQSKLICLFNAKVECATEKTTKNPIIINK